MNSTNGALDFDVVIRNSDFKRSFDDMERRVLGFTQKADRSVSELESTFSNLGRVAAGAFAFTQLSQLPAQIARVRGEFQQLEISFTTMLGSKAKADQLMSEVVEFAAKTPYGLKDTAAGAKQLLAYGASADTVTKTLTKLGDIASGIGAPLNDIVYLYGTTMTQGRLYTQDLNQFTGRGIPMIKELAKQFGVAESEVKGLVESGKVGFPEVEKVINSLTAKGSMFGGLMEQQSKSILGLQAQFSDAIDAMFNDIGRSQEGAIAEVIKGGIAIVENYQDVIDIMTVLVATYGAYKAVVIATAALQSSSAIIGSVQAWLSLATSIRSAKDAQLLFNLATVANPIGAAVALVAGLATAYAVYSKEVTQAEKAQKLLTDAHKKAEDGAASEIAKIQSLQTSIKNETLSREARNAKLKELIALSPKHLSSINLENVATDKGTGAINTYIEALKRKIEMQEIDAGMTESIKRQNSAKRGENELGIMDRFALALQNPGSQFSSNVGANTLKDFAQKTDAYNKQIVKDEDEIQAKFKERIKMLDEVGSKAEKTATQTVSATRKTVQAYEDEIKSKRDAQENTSTNAEYNKLQKEIEALEKARDRITGGKQKKVADKDLPQPFGSLAYYEQIARKADEIISKTPATKTDVLAKQNQIRIDAEKKAEEIRSRFVVKSFDDELEAKRSKYELYQKWVDNYSKAAADEQFASLIKQGDSYASYLNAEIKKLEDQANTPGVGLIGPEEEKLVKLKVEYDDVTGAETPLQKFQNKLDAIRDSSTSLTEELEALKKIQDELGDDSTATGRKTRGALSQRIIDTGSRRTDLLKDFLVNVAGSEQRELSIRKKYSDMRDALNKASANRKSDAYIKALERIDKAEKEDLEQDSEEAVRASKGYKELESLLMMSKQNETKIRLDALKKDLSLYEKGTEGYKKHLLRIRQAEEDHRQRSLQIWSSIAGALGDLGNSLSGYDGALGEIGGVLSGLASGAMQVKAAFTNMDDYLTSKGKLSLEGYAAVAQNVIQIIVGIIEAQKKRRDAEKQFATERLNFENEYSLALNKGIGKNYKENPFYTDYAGMIKSGVAQYADARQKYQDAIDKLEEGQAKIRQKNAVDGKTVLGMAGAGAATGAMIGAIAGAGVVSVVTTAVGAVIGGAVGAIAGLFAKKKKDVYGSLMDQYPELVTETAEGYAELNVEMAKALVNSNQVDDKTKEMLNNAISLNDAMQEARQQIRDVAVDLTGQFGDNLKNALVDAFKAGDTAANALRKTVGGMIADVASKLLFSKMLGPVFDQLIDDITKSIELEGTPVGALDRFNNYGLPAVESYFSGLEYLDKWLKDKGYDTIKGMDGAGSSNDPLSGSIKGVSAEVFNTVAGQVNAMRIYQAAANQMMGQQLVHLSRISSNTEFNRYLVMLESIDDRIKALNNNTMRWWG
ncbi:MAG TPA: tape measure protein [Dyadobacter sp.]|nr:tape measure protein [Dyadobacter sp.]